MFFLGDQVFLGANAEKFIFSTFCFEGNVPEDCKFMYVSDIRLPKSCYENVTGEYPYSIFHRHNCPVIRELIKILQQIEKELSETNFGKIFLPRFVMIGSIAEATKVGTFASELDITVQFEVSFIFQKLISNNSLSD